LLINQIIGFIRDMEDSNSDPNTKPFVWQLEIFLYFCYSYTKKHTKGLKPCINKINEGEFL